jgi:hypothetical protein
MNPRWNLDFTQLLRATHPRSWGNWTLDARIVPGAVGVVDPGTGGFEFVAALPSAQIADSSVAEIDWNIQSSTVRESSSAIPLDGSLTEPLTGTKITAALKTTWSFSRARSISSAFTVAKQSGLVDFVSQIEANHDWLVTEADALGLVSDGQITQGFGVITDVLLASCGLNLGSHSDTGSFSLEGSFGAANARLGTGTAGGRPFHVGSASNGLIDSHIWPSKPGEFATTLVPIAFEFASFVGDTILAGWTTHVSVLSIHLNNSHGGTYIVRAVASYVVGGKEMHCKTTVIAGMSTNLDPIPVEARDLRLDLTFVGIVQDTHHSFRWHTPISEFPAGEIIVDLHGFWPGDTRAVERVSGATG